MKKMLNLIFALVLVISLGLAVALPAAPALSATTYTLSVVTAGGGSVTTPGEGDFTYDAGTVVVLVATPGTGYNFVAWTGDTGTIADVSSITTTITMNTNYTISASFSINTFTITASAGGGGSISPSGAVSIANGGTQTFTITPDYGYRIYDVQVDGVSVGAVTGYTFYTVVASHTITASFALDTFTITAAIGSNGTISPSGAVTVNYGSSQTFTITPATGYHIAGVTVDGSSVGTGTSYTFTSVTASHTISASFAINTYTATASAGANGSVSPAGGIVVNYGGSQAFTVTPNTGYHIANVLVDGASLGPVAGYTFTGVISDHTLAASFAINTYTITPNIGEHGMTTPFLATTVNYGGSQTVNIAPNKGYHVADVQVDGASVGAVATYTFTNITANHNLAVTFAINTYAVTPTAGGNGTILPSNAQVVNYGDSRTFTIAANTGYRIADVVVDGTSVGPVNSYTFTNVTAVHTIAVTFAIGWPFYTAIVIGVVLVFLLGFLAGKGGKHK